MSSPTTDQWPIYTGDENARCVHCGLSWDAHVCGGEGQAWCPQKALECRREAKSSKDRSLRLRQLNDLHNSLVNTAQETFCPALRWAMDQLGCPYAAASSVETSKEESYK